MSNSFEEALKERLHTRRLDKLAGSFSAACISKGHCYTTDDGSNVFAKTSGSQHARVMFDGEFEALRHIRATNTIRTPKPIAVLHNFDIKNNSAFVMEYLNINTLTSSAAIKLGSDLAKLHDYNNKVIRFNQRASKWIAKKIPSSKQAVENRTKYTSHDLNQTRSSKSSDTDQNDSEADENTQFSKHNMRVHSSNNSTSNKQVVTAETKSMELTDYPEKFVPEPHSKEVEQFGFDVPTSCGSIPQVNEWTSDWISFYARHRLDRTIRMILSDHSDRDLNEQWSHLQLKCDKFFSDFEYKGSRKGEIIPSLLHGDLWSGNAAQLEENSQPVVYDPASFYGHSEYEFGIVRMFSGFPKEFETSYFDEMPKKKLFEKRNKFYQLFHHLNHWNHFGSGYRSSSLRIMKDLNVERI